MKQFLLITFLISSISSFAQDLTSKIPKDALAVATIKGDNLTQLMSIDELNNSYIGKEILKDLSKRREQPYTSLDDLGFNLEAASHYFYQANDSISYNVILIPIKNVTKLEQFMTSKNHNEVVTKDGFRTLYSEYNTDAIFWNNSAMVMVMGKVTDRYFEKPEIMERYGLQAMPEYDYGTYNDYGEYDDTEVYDTPYEDATITEDGEEVYESHDIIDDAIDEVEETVAESTEDEIEEVDEVIEVYDDAYNSDYSYDNDPYNIAYNNNYKIKDSLQKTWSLNQALKTLSQSGGESIVNNTSYMSSLDKNAEATLWVGDFAKIYDNLMGGNLYYENLMGFNIGSMYADSGMSAKLYAEKDEMRLKTSYTMSKSMADSYRKMMDQKINHKFFNYINEDRMVGYMSYVLNTEAALKEYPNILKNLYKNMPAYGDEAELAIDLVELLLDEEAVAKVFPGDMLFLLSGISKKEMTYKSYEYNDDFEYEEIERTKMETVPDFLMMMTSEDQKLLKKLTNYGIKKGVVESKNGYYSMVIPESPLSIFMAFKDDIIFFGTSEMEINQIMRGTFDAKLSSKHKKLLKNSNYSAFLSGKQLVSKIPVDELAVKDMKKLNWFLQNSEDAYLSTSKMKGNVFEADMVVGVPASQENALKYIFNMIEEFSK